MEAQLLRLVGLVSAELSTQLTGCALSAVGTLCDFASPKRSQCLEAWATMVASDQSMRRATKHLLRRCVDFCDSPADNMVLKAVDVALTAGESAALQQVQYMFSSACAET